MCVYIYKYNTLIMKEEEVINLTGWGARDEREGKLCNYILIIKNCKNLNKKFG